MVLDCSDNFATRFALNQACQTARTPLVSGAAIRWDGQITVFDGQPGGPCYRCLYTEDGEEELRCSENGVVAPLVGIIGAMQALEAIKLLCGVGEAAGRPPADARRACACNGVNCACGPTPPARCVAGLDPVHPRFRQLRLG